MGVLSFTDCPNKCRDGYYFDPYTRRKVRCQYCEAKRKDAVKDVIKFEDGKSLADLLNLPESYASYSDFDFDSVMPESVRRWIDLDSITRIREKLQGLFSASALGEVPDHSILFNLGARAYATNFIYSYLARSYISGMLVSPFVTARDVFLLQRQEIEGSEKDTLKDVTYGSLLKTDICVVHILAGSPYEYIRAVRGLMQARAHNKKSTLVFTDTWWFNTGEQSEVYIKASLQNLYSDDAYSQSVAELVSVGYTGSKHYVGGKSKNPNTSPQDNKSSNTGSTIGVSIETLRGMELGDCL